MNALAVSTDTTLRGFSTDTALSAGYKVISPVETPKRRDFTSSPTICISNRGDDPSVVSDDLVDPLAKYRSYYTIIRAAEEAQRAVVNTQSTDLWSLVSIEEFLKPSATKTDWLALARAALVKPMFSRDWLTSHAESYITLARKAFTIDTAGARHSWQLFERLASASVYAAILGEILSGAGFEQQEIYEDYLENEVLEFSRGMERIVLVVSTDWVQTMSYLKEEFATETFQMADHPTVAVLEYVEKLLTQE